MRKAKKTARILGYLTFLAPVAAIVSTSSAWAVNKWYVYSPFELGAGQSLQQVVANIINIAFMAAGLVAVIYLIIGGFKYVTSGGNAEAIEGAKATILNAIIGLIVIFISFLLVNYILGAMDIKSFLNPGTEYTDF